MYEQQQQHRRRRHGRRNKKYIKKFKQKCKATEKFVQHGNELVDNLISMSTWSFHSFR